MKITPEMVNAAKRVFLSPKFHLGNREDLSDCVRAMLEAALKDPFPFRITAEVKPVEADSDQHGFVLAWKKHEGWDVVKWSHVGTYEYPYWMPMPPDPAGETKPREINRPEHGIEW